MSARSPRRFIFTTTDIGFLVVGPQISWYHISRTLHNGPEHTTELPTMHLAQKHKVHDETNVSSPVSTNWLPILFIFATSPHPHARVALLH